MKPYGNIQDLNQTPKLMKDLNVKFSLLDVQLLVLELAEIKLIKVSQSSRNYKK